MAIDWLETITDGPITPDHVLGIQWNDRGHYMEWNLACGRVPVACFYSAHAVTKFAFIRGSLSPDSLSMINQLRKEETELLDKWTQPMYQLEYTIKSISGQETYDIDTKVWSKKWPIRPYNHRLML
jgi:hypothetical protein